MTTSVSGMAGLLRDTKDVTFQDSGDPGRWTTMCGDQKQTELIALTVVQWPFTAQGWKTSIRSFSLHEVERLKNRFQRSAKIFKLTFTLKLTQTWRKRVQSFESCFSKHVEFRTMIQHAAGQTQEVWNVKKKIHSFGVLLTGWGFICGFFRGSGMSFVCPFNTNICF